MDNLSDIELYTRVLSDPLPHGKVDALYLFAQKQENQSSVLESAIALFHLQIADVILIPAPTFPSSNYKGYDAWKNHLMQHGVSKHVIQPVQISEESAFTAFSESVALINYAQAQNYERMIIMAAPFHQVSAFLAMVSTLKQNDSLLNIYNQPGAPLVWNDPVKGKTSSDSVLRHQLITMEIQEIKQDQETGKLVETTVALDYLNQRKQ